MISFKYLGSITNEKLDSDGKIKARCRIAKEILRKNVMRANDLMLKLNRSLRYSSMEYKYELWNEVRLSIRKSYRDVASSIKNFMD